MGSDGEWGEVLRVRVGDFSREASTIYCDVNDAFGGMQPAFVREPPIRSASGSNRKNELRACPMGSWGIPQYERTALADVIGCCEIWGRRPPNRE